MKHINRDTKHCIERSPRDHQLALRLNALLAKFGELHLSRKQVRLNYNTCFHKIADSFHIGGSCLDRLIGNALLRLRNQHAVVIAKHVESQLLLDRLALGIRLLLTYARLPDSSVGLLLIKQRKSKRHRGANVGKRVGIVEEARIEVLRSESSLLQQRAEYKNRIVASCGDLTETNHRNASGACFLQLTVR